MIRSLFKYLWKQAFGRNEKIEDIVFSSYFERVNFHVPKSDTKKLFIFLRTTLSRVASICKYKKQTNSGVSSGSIHLHNSNDGRKIWLNFLNSKFNTSIDNSYPLTDLPHSFTFIQKIKLVSLLIAALPLSFVISRKKPAAKQNLIALPALIVNLFTLSRLAGQGKVIYHTGVYIPESNIISYFLMHQKSQSFFFVSGTPLHKYLNKIYCTKLFASNAYQKEEAKSLSDTVIADEVTVIGPFSSATLKYNHTEAKKGVIAVYTSGTWKRRELNINFDKEIEEKERKILKFLARYNRETIDPLSILIFLHPIEQKNNEDYEKAKENYWNLAADKEHITFSEREASSTTNFDRAEIAITSISNILFERLYAGFKTLVVNDENDWFPIPNSSLNNVTASTYERLKLLLDNNIKMTSEEFFIENNLKEYLADAN